MALGGGYEFGRDGMDACPDILTDGRRKFPLCSLGPTPKSRDASTIRKLRPEGESSLHRSIGNGLEISNI